MSVPLFLLVTFVVVYGIIYVICRWLFRRSKNLTASVQRTVFVLAVLGVILQIGDIDRDIDKGHPTSYVVGTSIGAALAFNIPAIIAAVLERRRRRKLAVEA